MAVACAQLAGSFNNTRIEPGDKIGDFVITNGMQGNFTHGFDVECSEPGEITVRDSGVFDNGGPFVSTSTYIFSEP